MNSTCAARLAGSENLGEFVDSLKEDGDKIIAALDELLTRWR
jgi:hypothetical protein